ncbi:unnamed protein product [Ceutorhynchus assimilis]|uniref:Uncharacterized protein n=1 Tax=Ceutorhynchus assimilis TaxID=467358 RepID=A0A9N9MM58_9CUCU|nr:unnamed protein product [Ceutorhynchus assimilis]
MDFIVFVCFCAIVSMKIAENVADVQENAIEKEEKFMAKAEKGSNNNQGLANKILPFLIIPFLISSAIIPLMLISIKFLMAKAIFVGKIAVALMLVSFLRRRATGGGVFNHYDPNIAEEHYGYKGIEELGVYIHKRRKKRK